jgi:hypothetical protein
MLVEDNVPLEFFTGKGFQMLLGGPAGKLEVPLDPQAVAKQLYDLYVEKLDGLKNELAGKLVYLKFDGYTRQNKHFINIGVQFFAEGSIQVK